MPSEIKNGRVPPWISVPISPEHSCLTLSRHKPGNKSMDPFISCINERESITCEKQQLSGSFKRSAEEEEEDASPVKRSSHSKRWKNVSKQTLKVAGKSVKEEKKLLDLCFCDSSFKGITSGGFCSYQEQSRLRPFYLFTHTFLRRRPKTAFNFRRVSVGQRTAAS